MEGSFGGQPPPPGASSLFVTPAAASAPATQQQQQRPYETPQQPMAAAPFVTSPSNASVVSPTGSQAAAPLASPQYQQQQQQQQQQQPSSVVSPVRGAGPGRPGAQRAVYAQPSNFMQNPTSPLAGGGGGNGFVGGGIAQHQQQQHTSLRGAQSSGLGDADESPVAYALNQKNAYQRRFDALIDATTPHVPQRYMALAALALLFLLRILLVQGYYIVCYAWGIYLLNIFLAFLTPKFDPSADDSTGLDNDGGIAGLDGESNADSISTLLPGAKKKGSATGAALLPTKGDEFKPFIRRLPEFKFWYTATRATCYAIVASFIPFFDVPVFWPILLIYFCLLFFLTMRRQIQHMVKYKYLPFDIGKKKFANAAAASGRGR